MPQLVEQKQSQQQESQQKDNLRPNGKPITQTTNPSIIVTAPAGACGIVPLSLSFQTIINNIMCYY